MEVKIGIQSVPRELIVETDATPEQVEESLADALRVPHGVLTLTGRNGGRLLVPADKVAFLEYGANDSRRVGFGNIV
ncbi:MAG: DUF3107 domain-containing protein [Streptosporangiaceae bacterium]